MNFIQQVESKLKEKGIEIEYTLLRFIWKTMLEVVKENLIQKNQVMLPKLGTFYVLYQKERIKEFINKNGILRSGKTKPKIRIKTSQYLTDAVIQAKNQRLGNDES